MKKNVKSKIKSVGVLCSGGDAPGMNAAVRSVVRSGIYHGLEVYGIYKGYSGLLEGHIEQMTLRSVANIIQRGGTIIKTDRCKAFFEKSAREEATHILRRKKIDSLIVIGGDGSYAGAHLMGRENDFPIIGLPGTIDNDIFGSEYTIGFDTAVNTALDAIDKIRDTASSHDRVFLVEVMGRTSSEIAIRVGVSGGAESIVVPDAEGIVSPHTQIGSIIKNLKRSERGMKSSSIVIVAEGSKPGVTYKLAKLLKSKAKIDARVAILGHVQRGGSPSAMDRYMASLMGAESIQEILSGKKDLSIGIVDGKVASIPFSVSIGRHKKPDQKLLKLAEILAS